MSAIPTVELYRGEQGWYWRRRAVNGEITAIGGEAYARRIDCKRSLRRTLLPPYRIVRL